MSRLAGRTRSAMNRVCRGMILDRPFGTFELPAIALVRKRDYQSRGGRDIERSTVPAIRGSNAAHMTMRSIE